jgi:hypothetical protein
MTSQKTPQTMKPATAAKKLGVYLGAAPAEFQDGVVSRDELNALQADPPQWLQDLRRNGPHPRPVVAAKLGVSIGGLTRAGVTEPLTTDQIEELKAANPDWLEHEREVQAEFRQEQQQLKDRDTKPATPAKSTSKKPAKSKKPGRPARSR